MADDAMERAHEIYGKLGWKWNGAKYAWRSPAGARVRFRPLERVTDADKYQGQNVTDACVEEAGQYPDPRPIDRLNGVLRSAHGVPTQLLLTGNPGGAGQLWLKSRYIDPWPAGMRVLSRPLPNGHGHRYVYIPSRLTNNRILLAHDPGYVNRLYQVGSAELVRAWLDGDWDAIEGAYFDCWRSSKHVIEPFPIPEGWTRFRSFDWGSASPFSVGWWAVADGSLGFPRGALIRYREWYGAKGANIGLKMRNEDIAKGILAREDDTRLIAYSVADPSIFNEAGGPSIAESGFTSNGVHFRPADNARSPLKGGPVTGWAHVRDRLLGVGSEGNEPGTPMIYCFKTCVDSIRTVPVLQHDDVKPEDLDTKGEDHVADDWRYACASRPWVRPTPEKDPPRTIVVGGKSTVTLDDMWKYSDSNKDTRI